MMKYSRCKIAITLYSLKQTGPLMSLQLKKAAYTNGRKPGDASFMDGSKLRIGKSSLYSRLNSVHNIAFQWTNGINLDKLRIGKSSLYSRLNSVHNIAFQWTNGINLDKLRIELKKTFIGID